MRFWFGKSTKSTESPSRGRRSNRPSGSVSSTTESLATAPSIQEQTAPEQSVPEQSVPEQSFPEQPVPEQSVPGQSVPEQSIPESVESTTGKMAAIVQPAPETPDTYPITGIPVPDEPLVGPYKKVGVRQNIDEWSADPDNALQVQLFVMALDRFQKIDPTTRDSYFQIAGIHGQPNVPWDEPKVTEEDTMNRGYCTHNNVLFPIWHRAYLNLYEQRLYEIMVDDIIPNFPAKSQGQWREEADSWRFPFWDFGRTCRVPDLAKYPTTVVPTADGTGEVRIDNPLFQFKMPNGLPMSSGKVLDFKDPWVEGDKGEMLYYGDAIATSRWPDAADVKKGSKSWRHGVVNNYKVEDTMRVTYTDNESVTQATELQYRLLTVPMDYPTVATTANVGGDSGAASDLNLEGLHNTVHGWVGGTLNGHMGQIPVASFDPMFWLLHCNVDRLFAIWQALNPTKWFEKSTINAFSQLTVGHEGAQSEITPLTPLRPFHKDTKGNYLNANDVRWTYDSGFTYPELQTWKEEYNPDGKFNNDLLLADINKTVNEYYGESRKLLLEADPSLGGIDKQDDGTKSVEFSFSVRYKVYAFGGEPYWINLYISQDEGIQNPSIDLINSIYNFSQKPKSGDNVNCEKCVDNELAGLKVTSQIPVTPVLLSLLKSGKKLASLNKEDVLEFLKKRLYWRVTRNGKEQPSYEVAKTELEIIGLTNDVFQSNDPAKPPALDNFEEVPELKGGPDGALDDSLKQPVVPPPAPVSRAPKTTLALGEHLPFPTPLAEDAVVLVDSRKVNLKPFSGSSIDNTQISFTTEGPGSEITFLLSIRREEGQIVFNHLLGGAWGTEVRISLENRFRKPSATILIHDQGDGYEVFIDWRHAVWYEKADKSKIAKYVHYDINEGYTPALSRELNVRFFPEMKALFKE